MMTKKDYKAIGLAIAHALVKSMEDVESEHSINVRNNLISEFSRILMEDNPNFDRARFTEFIIKEIHELQC